MLYLHVGSTTRQHTTSGVMGSSSAMAMFYRCARNVTMRDLTIMTVDDHWLPAVLGFQNKPSQHWKKDAIHPEEYIASYLNCLLLAVS